MSGRKARSSEHRISFSVSEWIRSFQTFDRTSAASADYFVPALRLACAIADKICNLEEEKGRSPTPSVDWIDSISVYSNHLREDSTKNVSDNILADGDDGDIRVEISPSLFVETVSNDDNEAQKMNGILYSLGIVFYEIFSRGERPAEIEELKRKGDKPKGFETGTQDVSEDFNPFHQGGTIDYAAGELSVFQNLLSDYNLSDDDSTSYDLTFQEGDGPRKKRAQNENITHENNNNNTLCSISVEPLKEKGVPVSLCDLIANMLNCAEGTLRNDDAYNDMSEVRDDLQLMLDKPSIYLHDQDMGLLSTTGLQIRDTVFGRNAELSTIKEAYRRTMS
eukprot:scaffold2995_cov135-Skeletonema_menzelii.AAC.10